MLIEGQPLTVEIEEPPAPPYVRSWSDVVQLAMTAATVVLAVALTRSSAGAIRAVEREVLRGVEGLTTVVMSFVVGVIQTIAAYAPLAFLIVMLVLRRFRRLAVALPAAVIAGTLMRLAERVLELGELSAPLTRRLGGPGFRTGGGVFPSPAYLAAATAVVTVEMPWLSRSWRRWAVILLVVLGLGRLAAGTAEDLPTNLLAAYALGWFVGSALLLAAGRPNRRPRGADVVAALDAHGISVDRIVAVTGRQYGTDLYRTTRPDGRRLGVKIRRGGDRAADSAVQAWRTLRLRQPAGEHPFWPPERRVEHEALAAMVARRAGVSAPEVLAVSRLGADDDSAMIAVEAIPATPLDAVGADDWSDDLLAAVWSAVLALRAARISHRRLGLGNLRRADDGTVMVVTFDHAVLGAAPDLLHDDLVEVMCATATRVGAERSVAAAVAAVGPDELAAVLPRWQPLVLSATTRRAVRAHAGLFEAMRTEVRRVCAVEDVPLEQVARIRPLTALMVVMSAVAVYLVLPELVHTSAFVPRLLQADRSWAVGALTASALTYVAAAIALSGAVAAPVRIRRLTVAQVACQFADFASPLRVGAMALNTRFLQRRGVGGPQAVAAVGLNAAASFVTHMALLGVFSYWLGNTGAVVALPGGATVAVVVAGIAVVGAVVVAVPAGRRLLAAQVAPVASQALVGLREVGRRPTKVIVLFTGTFLLSILYIVALACAVRATGADLSLAAVGVVFLGTAVVASAAPTPSGLGAVEAAMTAGFIGVGLDADTALLAVVLYRLATFWLPLLPGWLAFTHLQRRGDI